MRTPPAIECCGDFLRDVIERVRDRLERARSRAIARRSAARDRAVQARCGDEKYMCYTFYSPDEARRDHARELDLDAGVHHLFVYQTFGAEP